MCAQSHLRLIVMLTEWLSTMLAGLATDDPVTLLLIAAAVYFFAGIIKGTLGIGFPTAAVSMLAQFTDARTAITIVIMPMLFTNVWQVIRGRQFLSVIRQVWLLLLCMLIFIAIFGQLSSIVRADVLAVVLGSIVAFYALYSLFAQPMVLPEKWDTPAQVSAGVAAGIMGGMVSVWAPPILIYLSARRLPKDLFVATAGVILLLGTIVLLLSYVQSGVLGYGLFLCSMLLIAPSLSGFTVGETIRKHLSAKRFERLLLWFFFIMGLNLIRRAIL